MNAFRRIRLASSLLLLVLGACNGGGDPVLEVRRFEPQPCSSASNEQECFALEVAIQGEERWYGSGFCNLVATDESGTEVERVDHVGPFEFGEQMAVEQEVIVPKVDAAEWEPHCAPGGEG